jgi:hypothetical protein
MLYRTIDIAPSSVRASLRAIASGKKPRLAPELISQLVLDGVLDEASSPAPSNEWTRFASSLFALEDPRGGAQ